MSPSTKSPILEAVGVTKTYGEFLAVDHVDFVVPRGVIYGILGPNGAGKTTVLRMINDILRPDSGSIRLFGDLVPGPIAAKRIGYLPEERGLYPKMSVMETLVFFGELRGLTQTTARKRGQAWLERLDIADWRDHKVQDLSKGMQQKVQFAAALSHDPELLILDEPWSGLDPINADVLRDVVMEQKRAGKTILFSSHLMEQAEKICDAICIIARGRRAAEGTLSSLKANASCDGRVAVTLERTEDREKFLGFASSALVQELSEKSDERDTWHVQLAPSCPPEMFLSQLLANEVAIRSFTRVQPSLHQIFVDSVGHDATTAMSGRTTKGSEPC